jgi:hypothetical protein
MAISQQRPTMQASAIKDGNLIVMSNNHQINIGDQRMDWLPVLKF